MNDINLNKSIFSNGLRQNAYFIYTALKELGYKPFWIINDKIINFKPFIDEKYTLLNEVTCDNCDLIIIIGSNIRKIKYDIPIIAINLGHLYEELFSKSYLEKNNIKLLQFTENKIKKTYTSPHYNHYSGLISEFNKTTDTEIFPYIWEPLFIKYNNYTNNKNTPLNIYICEPNINVTKNCIIPLMIINRLLKNDNNINLINEIHIYSGTNYPCLNNWIKQNLIFLYKYINRVIIKKRENINDIFKNKGVILSHQNDTELNYLYFETIYNKLPLVHNSSFLNNDNIGLYYHKNDINVGSKQLLSALKYGDNNDYNEYLKKFSIYNKNNLSLINNIINENIN